MSDSLNPLNGSESKNGNIDLLKREYDKQIELIRTEYEEKLAKVNQVYKKQLEAERKVLFNSWRWRIGNFQVGLLLLAKDSAVFAAQKIVSLYDNLCRLNKDTRMLPPTSNQEKFLFHEDKLNRKLVPSIACVLDTFTYECFKPEFNIIGLTPISWKKQIRTFKPDAILIESAWSGNNGSWRFYIGQLGKQKKKGLKSLIDEANQQDIPTIFWNKEDPVHFDHFICDAKLFDYVFTTDSLMLPKYLSIIKHKNVFPLPFAAQEGIHNPIMERERKRKVCFAGTYYNTNHAERAIDIELLLRPATDYGLDIFDRKFGAKGYEEEMYRFPDQYRSFVKGGLEYKDMVRAYKHYRAFLNVNSVKRSPTMFSRRVFELLASGTPVISTYSKGIADLLGEDVVLFVETAEDTKRYLEKVMSDDQFWWDHSIRGMRRVLDNHTYYHRAKTICDIVGIRHQTIPPVRFLLVSAVSSYEDVLFLFEIIRKQTYTHHGLILISLINDEKQRKLVDEELNKVENRNIWLVENYHNAIRQAKVMEADFNYVAIISCKNYYGPEYLKDYSRVLKYFKGKAIGKNSCFVSGNKGRPDLINKGNEFQLTSKTQSGSLVIEIKSFSSLSLNELFANREFQAESNEILSTDPFNFLLNGRYANSSAQSLSVL